MRGQLGGSIMKRISLVLAATLLGTASPALAQATRTWVSGVGDDVNPCSRTAPCKTFAGAISKTAANGEINVIDPGGFGAVTITKSITIDGYGPESSILAANTSGIIINGAGIVVTIRNLSINGAATAGGSGIRILNAGAVNLDNLRIANFSATTGTSGRAVSVETSAPNVRVSIADSTFHNLGNVGIGVFPSAGSVLLDFDRLNISKAGTHGIHLGLNSDLTLSNSFISGNLAGAAVALNGTGSSAHISHSVLSNNQVGVLSGAAGGTPVVRLFDTVVTGSTIEGLRINTGTIVSHGNNAIVGNAGNQTPSSNIGEQ